MQSSGLSSTGSSSNGGPTNLRAHMMPPPLLTGWFVVSVADFVGISMALYGTRKKFRKFLIGINGISEAFTLTLK